MTGRSETERAPRLATRAAATLVLILIVLVAALSVTSSNGAPSVDPPIDAALLTPDAAASGEAPQLLARGDADPTREAAAEPPALVFSDDAAEAVTARSFYALDAATGEALAAREADLEVPIASTVKIATALVVVEHAALDEEVAILDSDLVDYMVQSNMALVAGDVLTVEQLRHGALIASGSDGANALARYVGSKLDGGDDPIAAFVDAMNAYARDHGLTRTHFVDPTGDNDEDAYSTAHDIALLGAELMANETLAAIVGSASYSFTSAGNGALYEGFTTNQLLGAEGVVGIKTGSTGLAGGCVILARETADGLQIVAVLGSDLVYEENVIVLDARWDDARRIFALLD
ncbi:MAG: serine hydrolase [Thermomicrobiales bacterium]|nr:serine hydrolase [Thermomicrobiales bacterium]